jgi:glycosyltransferase involved in cell wall biosynthesis
LTAVADPPEPTRRRETPAPAPADLGAMAADAGLRRVHLLAWRDLDDDEAGGSEQHAHAIVSRWAAAGIDVTMRTSAVANLPERAERAGYRIVRRGGRLAVFPRGALSELVGRHGRRDGLVEIWNGMPWFSPLWATGPKVTWLHHVHGPMWRMTLKPRHARLGEAIEQRVAPPLYRRTRVVTLAESSRRELIDRFGFAADRVHVVSPGVDPQYVPDPARRRATPLMVAVGRLAPVKRLDALVRAAAEARRSVAGLELVIIGDGYERPAIEAAVRALDASGWVRFAGRVAPEALVDWYQQAWVVSSASVAEGWGMTITEAAACGTPAVATDIVGHRDAIVDGVTGMVVPLDGLGVALARVLADPGLRHRLGAAARARAAGFSWDSAAAGTLAALALEAKRHRR